MRSIQGDRLRRSTDMAAVTPMSVSSHCFTPLRMRSYCPAPKFWPTKVHRAVPMALLVTQ